MALRIERYAFGVRRGRVLGFLACLLLVGCGSAATQTMTVTATSSASSAPVAPDPTLDAQCTAEPNLPPSCTQGDYQVAITIGAHCSNPSVDQPSTWQWTYDGSGTVRCMTKPAAGPPPAPTLPSPRSNGGVVACIGAECHQDGRETEWPMPVGNSCGPGRSWTAAGADPKTGAGLYRCKPGSGF